MTGPRYIIHIGRPSAVHSAGRGRIAAAPGGASIRQASRLTSEGAATVNASISRIIARSEARLRRLAPASPQMSAWYFRLFRTRAAPKLAIRNRLKYQ